MVSTAITRLGGELRNIFSDVAEEDVEYVINQVASQEHGGI